MGNLSTHLVLTAVTGADVFLKLFVAARTVYEATEPLVRILGRNQLTASVNAGVTSIEHGFLLHRTPELLHRTAMSAIFLCPTLRVIESIRADPQWCRQRLIPGAWPDELSTVTAARAAGVQLLAGTDSGVYGVRPGDVWREITLLAQHCGSRWDALQAATCSAGRALGRDDLGNLRAGAVADFLLLRREPLAQDIDARDVAAVVQTGRLVAGALRPERTLNGVTLKVSPA